jgi:mRNA interferase RelE/StbE
MVLKENNKPPKYQVTLTRQAERFLSKIPKNYYQLISEHLVALGNNPFPNGSIKLHGGDNDYRIRVGPYRILYTVHHKELIIAVIMIGHRKDVYD